MAVTKDRESHLGEPYGLSDPDLVEMYRLVRADLTIRAVQSRISH